MALGVEKRSSEQTGGGFGNFAVFLPVVILRPGVEVEVNDGSLGLATLAAVDVDGAAVARPTTVGGMDDEFDARDIGTGAGEVTTGKAGFGLVTNEEADGFAGADVADHFAIDPADGVKLAGPVGFVVGPAEPGGGVRFPFGGHGKAQVGGRGGAGRDRFSHKMAASIGGAKSGRNSGVAGDRTSYFGLERGQSYPPWAKFAHAGGQDRPRSKPKRTVAAALKPLDRNGRLP